jgi:hypothetical protein
MWRYLWVQRGSAEGGGEILCRQHVREAQEKTVQISEVMIAYGHNSPAYFIRLSAANPCNTQMVWAARKDKPLLAGYLIKKRQEIRPAKCSIIG